MRFLSYLAVCFASAAVTCAAWAADEWPQFRGPDGQGHAQASDLPVQWSEKKNIVWKTAVPGRGWSSPVVSGDDIWMTAAVESAATQEQLLKKLSDPKRAGKRQLASELSLRAICVDRNSGKIKHNFLLLEVDDPDPIHKLNSYASPTPVLEKGRLYCHFGTYGNACLDTATGKVLWRRIIPLTHYVGPGSSPVMYKNLFVLAYDGVERQFILALDKQTGATVWKMDRPPMRASDGDRKKSYSTPLVVQHDGQDELVVAGSQWIVSYQPTTGKELWRVDHGSGFSLVPRPVAGQGMVYFSTGFGKAQLWAIRLGGKGDVTKTHVAWKATKQIPTKPSPVLIDGRVIVMADSGVASCFDAVTGKVLWVKRVAGNYSASPLWADGKLFLASQEGKISVVKPSETFELVAENELEGQFMASPIAIGRSLFVRSDTHLYRIEKK
jgi:outer membrane protein assembly factor BamB